MRHPIARATGPVAGAFVAAGLLLGACGDDGPGDDATAGTTTASPGPAGSATTVGGGAGSVTCETGAAGDMAAGGSGDVEISGFTFRPGDIEIDAGATVTFTNADPTDHSVWSAERADGEPTWLSAGADPGASLPELLREGDASTCTFDTAGTYAYLCGIHNSMTGTVVVR